MRKIVVLGSTGSIGCQTLDIVRAFPDEFEVVGLAAGSNTRAVAAAGRGIAEFRPTSFSIAVAAPDDLARHVTETPMEEMVVAAPRWTW